MLSDELKLYPLCEIRQVEYDPGSNNGGMGEIYTAKILRINDADETIDFSIPIYLGEKVDLKRNTRYSFVFLQDNSLKTAHGVFLQRIREDNVPMAKVKLVSSLKRIQRRDYFRIGCRIDMKFQTVKLWEEDFGKSDYLEKAVSKIDKDSFLDGTIIDISGGGLRFLSEAPIMDFPFMYFNFNLPIDGKDSNIQVCGKLLSRQPVPRTLLCTHRVKFYPEKSKVQDQILSYVYSMQRKLAKKEAGM